MKELKETINLMQSEDYKERFIAEYWQTKIRYEKLKDFCNKIEAGEIMKHSLNPVKIPQHDCPLDMLREQQGLMGRLLHVLELRAYIEGVDLSQVFTSFSVE